MSFGFVFCENVGQVLHFLFLFFFILFESGLDEEQEEINTIISPKNISLIICLVFVFIVRHLTYHTLQPFQVFLLHIVLSFSYLFLLFVGVLFRF